MLLLEFFCFPFSPFTHDTILMTDDFFMEKLFSCSFFQKALRFIWEIRTAVWQTAIPILTFSSVQLMVT